jgi:hypothetical protein
VAFVAGIAPPLRDGDGTWIRFIAQMLNGLDRLAVSERTQ